MQTLTVISGQFAAIGGGIIGIAANASILALVVLWGALLYWTYADAKRRIEDPLLVICATGASLLPFFGTMVYLIIRPPELLDEVRLREFELHAAELRLDTFDEQFCSNCDAPVQSDFLCCPSCSHQLKTPCSSCRRPVRYDWRVCPYCSNDLDIASAPVRSQRHREERSSLYR